MNRSTQVYLDAAQKETDDDYFSCIHISNAAEKIYGVYKNYLRLQESIDYREIFELVRLDRNLIHMSKNLMELLVYMTPEERQTQRVWMLLLMAAISENP